MSPERDRKHKTRVFGLIVFLLAIALRLRGCWRDGTLPSLLDRIREGVSAVN